MAQVCHEYNEFGHEAFDENKLQALYIQHDEGMYVARHIYSLVLCFICHKDANLGMINNKVKVMSDLLEESLSGLQPYLNAHAQDQL